jgi:hypothetical protein
MRLDALALALVVARVSETAAGLKSYTPNRRFWYPLGTRNLTAGLANIEISGTY